MKSFLPKNLPGQLALVIAVALLVASTVNFVLLLGERQRAALIEQSGPPMARFADVAAIVFADPPIELQRPNLLGRPQGPGRYSLQPNNLIDRHGLHRDSGMEDRLREALSDAGVKPVAIRASTRTLSRPDNISDAISALARNRDRDRGPDGPPRDFGPQGPGSGFGMGPGSGTAPGSSSRRSLMRAALPCTSRRKYNLARRTEPFWDTSSLSIRGLESGKIRSTPTPKLILRTVNVVRALVPFWRMATPSKTWMRSLSPSLILKCTFTVSPIWNVGWSVRSWSLSTTSVLCMGNSPKGHAALWG